jgi:hypothetical protein
MYAFQIPTTVVDDHDANLPPSQVPSRCDCDTVSNFTATGRLGENISLNVLRRVGFLMNRMSL